MSAARDRRYFPRLHLRAYATLTNGSNSYPVHLLDVSFKGALVALIHPHKLRDGDQIMLTIEPQERQSITMKGTLAHHNQHFLGLECQATGIEHKSRLHELIRHLQEEEQSRDLLQLLKDYKLTE